MAEVEARLALPGGKRVKLPQWALPVIPTAGIALAALIVAVTKSTDWAIPGDIGAALCIVLAIGGVRLAVVSTSERRTRVRRAREVVNILLETGKILQHQPGYQNLSPGCEPFSATENASSTATTAYSGPLFGHIETWRGTVGLKLRGKPFKRGTDTFVLEAGGNRLDPVLARLREVLAHLDSWVDHGD
jgi:hypothetical protein